MGGMVHTLAIIIDMFESKHVKRHFCRIQTLSTCTNNVECIVLLRFEREISLNMFLWQQERVV